MLEIEELRLEDELAELEEMCNELLHKWELSNKRKQPSANRSVDGNRKTEMLTQQDFTLEWPLEMVGTGLLELWRSLSSLSSGSAGRKKHSKWSLKHHTIAKKDIRKLNCHELVCATTAWALDIPEVTLADHRALLQHLNVISHRAWHNYMHIC